MNRQLFEIIARRVLAGDRIFLEPPGEMDAQYLKAAEDIDK